MTADRNLESDRPNPSLSAERGHRIVLLLMALWWGWGYDIGGVGIIRDIKTWDALFGRKDQADG